MHVCGGWLVLSPQDYLPLAQQGSSVRVKMDPPKLAPPRIINKDTSKLILLRNMALWKTWTTSQRLNNVDLEHTQHSFLRTLHKYLRRTPISAWDCWGIYSWKPVIPFSRYALWALLERTKKADIWKMQQNDRCSHSTSPLPCFLPPPSPSPALLNTPWSLPAYC